MKSDYKTVVVTGASSGIGAAVAESLSASGLTVHAIARREERLDELSKKTSCITHILDVCNTEEFVAFLESIEVDVLVNNAGVGRG